MINISILNLTRENEINKNIENNITQEKQTSFIETTLGKTINVAIDIGLRAILPDIIEDEFINIKNTIFEEGLKSGINQAINGAINMGKSALGIITGKFDNISQVQTAVKSGGIIDGVSSSLDYVLDKIVDKNLLSNNVVSVIKSGKNSILNNVSKNIENEFLNQISNIDKLSKYETNWRECYENRDFNGMEKEYKKIKQQLNNLIPLENTLNSARKIENIHLLIKNNGHNFDLSNDQLELANII